MQYLTQEPKLLSIEPNFGGSGTNVIIKGENLGENRDDIVSLTICGISCNSTIKWVSSKCIKAMVLNSYKARNGLGDVVLITTSGGKCLTLLQFELNITRVNILEESDFWIDEGIESLLPSMDQKDVVQLDSLEPDPLGIITNDISKGAKVTATINDIVNRFGVTGSASLFDENFSVNKFLVTRHYNSTWGELKKGLSFLRESLHIQQNKQESQSWLLNSSTVLVDMMNGLHALNQYAKKTSIDSEKLFTKSVSCYDMANTAFSCILRQQQDIDKLKMNIRLIESYEYFFNLPSLFEKALHTKNYQSAMDNLEQVKTLLEPMPRKDEIMRFFQRYIELLKNDIWKELTDCASFTRIKNHSDITSEYLLKYTNNCSPINESISTPITSTYTSTNTTPITTPISIKNKTNNFKNTKKDQNQWKCYSDQIEHMFTQQKLIKYLNVLDPANCHIWLYICEMNKNMTTLISNTENVYLSVYVRKIRQIFTGSDNDNFYTSNISDNSSTINNHNKLLSNVERQLSATPGIYENGGKSANSNRNSLYFTDDNSFLVNSNNGSTNSTNDDDLITQQINSMVSFVLKYCDNFYNELCDFMCACHYCLENNFSDSSFAKNYNDSITMIGDSFQMYFKALSNFLFEIELTINPTHNAFDRKSQNSVDEELIVNTNNANVRDSTNKILLTNTTTSESVDHECENNNNTNQPFKLVLISLLSYKQLSSLATKIASIVKVLPSLLDSIKYKERKLRFNSDIFKRVVNKQFTSLRDKWSSPALVNKTMKGQTDSTSTIHIDENVARKTSVNLNNENVARKSSVNLNNENVARKTSINLNNENVARKSSVYLSTEGGGASKTSINLNSTATISRIFHDLMYELCQRMFFICSEFTCDRLAIAYQNETWKVHDVNISNHNFNKDIPSISVNAENVPTICVNSNPFMSMGGVNSSKSSKLDSNPFLTKHNVVNVEDNVATTVTTTQFPIDFHRQFIHWTLSISFFVNPIINSKCLEDLDANQLKCHDSNVRKIFMVYYNKLMDTFKAVSTKKIVPNNFRNNNIAHNKTRDTIFLMIYCNVYYMVNELLPIANGLFTNKNPIVSDIIPQTVELSTFNDIFDIFDEFSNGILNQYVKVKFRSVLLPIVVSFSNADGVGYLYSIHSNTIQSHIYSFMIRLMHFTKDIVIFKKSTHIEVMKRLCNSVAAILHDNVNKISHPIKAYVVKQQIININALQVIFQGYIDEESGTLFKDSINKLQQLTNIDQRVISQTITQFAQQNSTLLNSLHF